jgi:ubiquinone/menaquinone biosynthesis C-methylase UbiE
MYKDFFSPEELERRKVLWGVLVGDFFQQFVDPRTDTVLDLGSGWGEFVNAVKAPRRLAVDVSDQYARFLAAGTLYSLQSCCHMAFKDRSIDVVFASNVFEHLPTRDGVLAALAECRRILRPDGRLLILQPNFKYCGPEYFDIFDHYQAYTHVSMREALQLAGFEVRRLYPRFLPFSTKQRLPQSALFVRLYLAMPLVWRLLGKQMFIVAEKARGRAEANASTRGPSPTIL